MSEIKINIFNLILKEYIKDKNLLWENIGGLIAYHNLYYKDIIGIEKDKDINNINDLYNNNLILKQNLIIVINEVLKLYVSRINGLTELDKEIKELNISFETAIFESKKTLSDNKTFVDFLFFVNYIEKERNMMIKYILKDIEYIKLSFVTIKYEKKAEEIKKNSKFYINKLNALINKIKKTKKEENKKIVFKLITPED